jgi:hypothetical protein
VLGSAKLQRDLLPPTIRSRSLLSCTHMFSPMLNNYVGIFCLALCVYLFVNHLLHLFTPFSCPIAPA